MYGIMIMIIHNIIMLCSHMITSSHITRVVLGPARHEDVPPCHGPCLSLVKTLSCHRSLNMMQHKAREGRDVPARPGPSLNSTHRHIYQHRASGRLQHTGMHCRQGYRRGAMASSCSSPPPPPPSK
jgi:hypothetical protein